MDAKIGIFLVGCMVGCPIGVLITALCAAAREFKRSTAWQTLATTVNSENGWAVH